MDRYRQIVDLSEDCIKELDLDGVVVAINDNGLKLFRATQPEDMEWKPLLITLACSLVGLLVFQEWPAGRYLSEATLWWSIFTIPFLAFSRPEKQAKRR